MTTKKFYTIGPSSADLLDRATSEVSKYFPKQSRRFRAEELVVATWDGVGYYNNKSDKVTAF